MQPETADFAPGNTTWRCRRNNVVVWRPICAAI